MATQKKSLRRSVVIPAGIAEEASKYAPREAKGNFNRLVVTALEEYARRRREERLAQELAAMAEDREVRRECERIAAEFSAAEMDGLEGGP